MSWGDDGRYGTYRDGKFIEVGTIDEVCAQLKEMVMSAREDRDRARAELQAMSDEKWKDTQLQEMKQRLQSMQDDYYGGFPISTSEHKAITDWKDQHWTNQHMAPTLELRIKQSGVSGGQFFYEFHPTAIGTAGSIICSRCLNKARRQFYQEMFAAEASGEKFDPHARWGELLKEYDVEFEFQSL